MSITQAKAPPPPARLFLRQLFTRLLLLVVLGTCMVWVVHQSSRRLDQNFEPAGFARGLLHGALMPMAMPNLLVGQDVTIYAANNRGRPYKLGYTMGVNGCGALFFGLTYWRLRRFRKELSRR